MQAILLIGVQGAGKTTFCTQRLLESHTHISQDLLKTAKRVRELVKACLAAQQPFVVDNTNALRSQRAEVISAAKAAGFRVIGYYFPCDRREAIRRNLQRGAGRVPPAGVAATHKRLEAPTLSEGFDELHGVMGAGRQVYDRGLAADGDVDLARQYELFVCCRPKRGVVSVCNQDSEEEAGKTMLSGKAVDLHGAGEWD